ncbi:hypothetical protein DFQ01_101370 [Paenibacillus cellulosilyticus]|uniref:Uncharacterized protein n=1 Tax=Paenibacillus cellulosilyticus TaxID=375489 RepID=A0A2V2Z0I5_9BACL|nr:hypothetical protein [Paenibacillus cellulosilyticus]PWW08645.1 hypothetical protein DFQ01_101370 [Paenibacillus cellulosilyticus]QKS48210.1 hypothetical protein HUB94_28465 [Paenibacillus cellulosilyticus]
MIQRFMYRAAWQQGRKEEGIKALADSGQALELVRQGRLMTAAAFHWQDNLFLYYESIDQEVSPEEMAGAAEPYLCDWPGRSEPCKWIRMVDVFHFNEPADTEHWLRKSPVERRGGRVAHLKPEMASSYIYYHYQLQEERAFFGPKYEIIGMHENLLFGYQEFPNVVEEPTVQGRLNTKGTPENWSDSRMDLHFQPWEDGHLYFKPIEQIFAYYMGDCQKDNE